MQKYILSNPPSFNYKIEYFQYLVHYLTVKQIQQKNNEFFSINSKYLKSITVWNINQYIIYLINGDLLLRNNYTVGEKTYSYKINPNLLVGFMAFKVLPGTRLYNKSIQKQKSKRSHANRLTQYLKRMYDLYQKLNFNYEKAEEWILSQPDESKQYYYLTSLQMIKDKRFRYFKRNKTNNRLDTNLTNLKSELRQFIIGDLVSIDLANSQPFLLYILIKRIQDNILNNNIKDIPLCSWLLDIDIVHWFGKQLFNDLLKCRLLDTFFKNGELLKFKDSVVSGCFYDVLKSSLSSEMLSREAVKEMVFTILFSRNELHKDYNRFVPFMKQKTLFAKVYPSIYKIIYILKKKDHTRLSILLQRIESKVFIDIICPDLVSNGIVPLTIHDSLIVRKDQSDKALNLCKKVFEKYFGVIPKFHVNPLNCNN